MSAFRRSDYILRPLNSKSRLPPNFNFAQVHQDFPDRGRIRVEFMFPAKRNAKGERLYTSHERELGFGAVFDWNNHGTNLEAAETELERIYGK